MIEKAIEYRQTLTRVQLIAVLMSLYKEEKYALKNQSEALEVPSVKNFYIIVKKMTLTQELNEILLLKERNNTIC